MNDLISRQALMKEFADFVKRSNNSDFARMPTWNDAVSLVDSMPPAQPEQKVGKWIVMDDDRISGRCSVCGWEAHLYEDDVVGMDYCPNCGAKMEEQDG